MKEETKQIFDILHKYLEENPDIRFTQALFNLGINEFASKTNPESKSFLLRDTYNDRDQVVLNRILEHKVNV